MLTSQFEIYLEQTALAAAAGVSDSIAVHGSRVDQLASALRSLEPELVLLGRYNCSVADLREAIEMWGPVGVELQAIFRPEAGGDEFTEGHYVIATHFNVTEKRVNVIDPDSASLLSRGWVDLKELERDWWEVNRFPGMNGNIQFRRSYGLIFGVSRRSGASWPISNGFEELSYKFVCAHSEFLDEQGGTVAGP